MRDKGKTEEGTFKGDVCNRGGCKGIINEYDKDGCCSCHINPPCAYCTTDTAYCPECDWSAEDETEKKSPAKTDPYYEAQKAKEQEIYTKMRQEIYAKMRHEKPIDKLEWLPIEHTHFTMIKIGVYPDGMTKGDVQKEIDGTFGGRFTKFANNVFEFVAYTD